MNQYGQQSYSPKTIRTTTLSFIHCGATGTLHHQWKDAATIRKINICNVFSRCYGTVTCPDFYNL